MTVAKQLATIYCKNGVKVKDLTSECSTSLQGVGKSTVPAFGVLFGTRGSARHSHCRDQGFDSHMLHGSLADQRLQGFFFIFFQISKYANPAKNLHRNSANSHELALTDSSQSCRDSPITNRFRVYWGNDQNVIFPKE